MVAGKRTPDFLEAANYALDDDFTIQEALTAWPGASINAPVFGLPTTLGFRV